MLTIGYTKDSYSEYKVEFEEAGGTRKWLQDCDSYDEALEHAFAVLMMEGKNGRVFSAAIWGYDDDSHFVESVGVDPDGMREVEYGKTYSVVDCLDDITWNEDEQKVMES